MFKNNSKHLNCDCYTATFMLQNFLDIFSDDIIYFFATLYFNYKTCWLALSNKYQVIFFV